jgi:hypothetical protein
MMVTQANLGGVVVPEDFGEDTFYGFRLCPVTGKLQIEIISEGNGTVQLPFDYILNVYDYRQWLWSKQALGFSFSNKGHLLMTTL